MSVAELPEPGVYVYATTGSAKVDALNGAAHTYPAETTITVTLEGCGARTAGRPGDDDVEMTAGYADARRAGGGPATPAGDVHALGACAWHALTGRVPGPPTERAPLVVLPRFSASNFMADVRRHRATFIYVLGSM